MFRLSFNDRKSLVFLKVHHLMMIISDNTSCVDGIVFDQAEIEQMNKKNQPVPPFTKVI